MSSLRRRGDDGRPSSKNAADASVSFVSRWYRRGASSQFDAPFLAALLVAEAALGILVIKKVAYTEIDWVAYMQEVEGYLAGERDYRNLRGGTGPLVYPAGFLYLFSLLRHFTDEGKSIRTAQYIFLGFYVVTQFVVLLLYQNRIRAIRSGRDGGPRLGEAARTRLVWSWRVAMAALCCSKRIHSIFLLRLFNDGPTMLLFYASVYLFARQQWFAGCVLYSLAVSVKMSVLLSAPGLLLLLLQASPNTWTLLWRLGAGCALPQLVVGAPFLRTYPVSYLRKAFELDRAFLYQWTVNWKFLPENVFTSKALSIILLVLHLAMLGFFAKAALASARTRAAGGRVLLPSPVAPTLSPHYVTYTLFVANFVGICFARTLHYQFYAWYYHTMPYLLWTTIRESNIRLMIRLALMMGLEYAFLTFPATPMSSGVLQVCHWITLASICVHGFPSSIEEAPSTPIHRGTATTPGSPTKKTI